MDQSSDLVRHLSMTTQGSWVLYVYLSNWYLPMYLVR